MTKRRIILNTDNYIVIHGKRAELTEEQLKALGIEAPKKNVFDRRKEGEKYYFINTRGEVESIHETSYPWDNDVYNIANYCTDENLMKQRVLHETLNRLLWRFSMEHDGNKINWQHPISSKVYIYYNYNAETWSIAETLRFRDVGQIYFYTRDIAKLAIEEIIKPFMAKHPEFRW